MCYLLFVLNRGKIHTKMFLICPVGGGGGGVGSYHACEKRKKINNMGEGFTLGDWGIGGSCGRIRMSKVSLNGRNIRCATATTVFYSDFVVTF